MTARVDIVCALHASYASHTVSALYARAHVNVQAVLEEFGKWVINGTYATLAVRDQFYQSIYRQIEDVGGMQ